ncbi:MAG: HAD family hydrolase [Provencibacterium sp.]|jgi:phosphoglycolate phosphatase|nr:HAD family hydrolase [Provencibacterium sp.]
MLDLHILWDWNGTLLDDVEVSVASLCDLLNELGMPPTDADAYRAQMEAPVERYYEKLFDLDRYPLPFLAERFIKGYRRHIGKARLQQDARQALELFAQAGLRQAILSSFEQSLLLTLLDHFEITPYFEFISGAKDCLGQSKLDRAQALFQQRGLLPARTFFIGDMVQDAEMAAALGANCILIPGGHQRREELAACGAPLAGSLLQAAAQILSRQ